MKGRGEEGKERKKERERKREKFKSDPTELSLDTIDSRLVCLQDLVHVDTREVYQEGTVLSSPNYPLQQYHAKSLK